MRPWIYFIYGTAVLIITTLINIGTAGEDGGSAHAWSSGSGGSSSGWSSGGSHK